MVSADRPRIYFGPTGTRKENERRFVEGRNRSERNRDLLAVHVSFQEVGVLRVSHNLSFDDLDFVARRALIAGSLKGVPGLLVMTEMMMSVIIISFCFDMSW